MSTQTIIRKDSLNAQQYHGAGQRSSTNACRKDLQMEICFLMTKCNLPDTKAKGSASSYTVSEEDSDLHEQAQKDKDMQRIWHSLQISSAQRMGYSAFNCRDLANMQRNEKPSVLKTTCYIQEKDDDVQQAEHGIGSTLQFPGKISGEKCADVRAALAIFDCKLNLDTEETNTILKQLKEKQTHHWTRTRGVQITVDEASRALGEATSCRDSSLIALQNKQNELGST
ncbi:hypothetical protein Tco_0154301 [Tanacetum coccineum]